MPVERRLVLDRLAAEVQPVTEDSFADLRPQALARIAARDVDDWPVVTAAQPEDDPDLRQLVVNGPEKQNRDLR